MAGMVLTDPIELEAGFGSLQLFPRSRFLSVLLAGVAVVAAACGESATPPEPEPQPATLAFTAEPGHTPLGEELFPAPAVVILDAAGDPVVSATTAVTLSLGAHPDGAALSGTLTVNAVGGIAEFGDIRVDRPGPGYTLTASAAGLADATSEAFDIPFRFTSVGVGSGHSCGMTPAGVYCWGLNTSGQLGAPIEFRSLVPARITQPDPTFGSLAVGRFHNCALTTAGAAHCWGSNWYGILGDGTTTDRTEATPVVAPAGVTFRIIAAGQDHTCALAHDGSAWCWGRNEDGQLGTGARDAFLAAHPLPEPVALPDGVTFDSLAVGGSHACGLTLAGEVYCWGDNGAGQIGNGDAQAGTGTQPVEPAPVPIAAPPGASFVAVSAGLHHTCALTTTGDAWCWGINQVGNLGDGSMDQSAIPVPVDAPAGVVFRQVDAGGHLTCGLTTEGAGWCWGDNGYGQLGTDDGSPHQLLPTPVAAPDGVAFTSLWAGSFHVCALDTDGRAWCWGSNAHGRLGDGTLQGRPHPVPVAGQ